MENYQIDSLDREILKALQADARQSYLDIARQLDVSGGTIHQRVNRMRAAGIITGSKITVDAKRLGHGVTVLLGLHLTNAKAMSKVLAKLETFPEVLEAYYTTGGFSLILKIAVRSIEDYHQFLIRKLQAIDEVQSTESFICMDQPINRDIEI
ncbi:Lrp/AsnC ligand binding domain-containing protein [Permianibacter aggregans]|uniref:AsnC family transcriptional regulator n=1 Tax=Permianibacter aggregans TaxID=1510150 RepID=A0A4R6V130_9GAMM|nr:Lrp/AsnC ligand binding domain-containing protein [Permianibacter aggregans]QGX39543.1 AsnC family transcriptional regulator [Permianibacter aggregans]TDQ49714.1 AsnC family transcriptional regulator [Permianibacter aggregans]